VARVKIDTAKLAAYVRQGGGPVLRDLDTRMTRVQIGARRQVGKRTGELARSTVKITSVDARGPFVRLGGGRVSLIHHQGTPAHIIVPTRRRALRYLRSGMIVFSRRVRHPGTRPNRYLTDNLPLAGGRTTVR
jgi:hypothetical protein